MSTALRPDVDAEQVVAAAAEAIRAYEAGGSAQRGGFAYDGRADEILQAALAPGADVWDWAPLARAALRRAHGGERPAAGVKNVTSEEVSDRPASRR